MESFIQKLTQLLQQKFPGSELELETATAHRVGGLLTWDGFTGKSQIDRQREVWRVLRTELTPDEQLQVAAMLTLTREEMSAARAG
jgi:stress-induced morphogen